MRSLFILLVALLTLGNTAAFAEKKEIDVKKMSEALAEFIDGCTEADIDAIQFEATKIKAPWTKEKMMRESKRTLRTSLPNTSTLLDDEIFKTEDPIFSSVVDESCEEDRSKLLGDAIYQGIYGCDESDQCGYIYKIQKIIDNQYYMLTLRGYHSN